MARPRPRSTHGGGGATTSHFHLPAQFLLGLIFLASGALLLLKKIGRDYLPFLPETVLIYICAIGSVLGGIHMVISKIWKPRMYIQ